MEQLIIPGTLPDYSAHTGHYHVGANMIGYLPESDVICADNIEDAVSFFLYKLQEARDEAEDMCCEIGNGHVGCEWRQLADEIERMQESGGENSKELQAKVLENGGWSYTYCPPVGADIRYWIEPVQPRKDANGSRTFEDKRICEWWQDQNDIKVPSSYGYVKSDYWGPGHRIVNTNGRDIGRVSKNEDGTWDAFLEVGPPQPGQVFVPVAKNVGLFVAEEILAVERELRKRDLPTSG